MTMHVIIGHTGDGRSDPGQCRDWRCDDYDWLEPFGSDYRADDDMAFSQITAPIDRVWTDKMDQIRVEIEGGETGTDAPAVPNADIISVTDEDKGDD